MTPEIQFVLFAGKLDKSPKPGKTPWPKLQGQLTSHKPVPVPPAALALEGAALTEALDPIKGRVQAISPAIYKPGTTRGNKNVEALTAFVADIDDGTPLNELSKLWVDAGGKPVACAHFTTFKSRASSPRVRVFFPFSAPVPVAEWPRIWRNLTHALTDGHNDPSTKDPARLHFMPACPADWLPEADAGFQEGVFLDPYAVPDAPIDPAEAARIEALSARRSQNWQTSTPGTGSGRPGDDYNQRATQSEVLALLERHGWRQDSERGGVIHLTRPGKASGTSGLLGFADGDASAFYCYSSNAAPLEGGRLYDGFGLLAALEHGGDFAAAAKELGSRGFGEPIEVKKASRDARKAAPVQACAEDPKPRSIGEFQNTDGGNADRLVHLFGQELRHVPGLGWRVWTGQRWEAGEELAARRARDVVRALYGHAEDLAGAARKETDAAVRKLLAAQITEAVNFAKKSDSAPRIAAIVQLARSDELIAADATEFELKPWRVAFPNGTWERGSFREHRREDFIEALTAVPYNAKADRADWDELLNRMTGGDEDLGMMLQDVAGYAFSGASSMRLLPWLYGPKGTGKSTFVELLQTALGACGKPLDWSLLSGEREAERLGAAVRNMRAVFLPEAGRKRLDADVLKMLSGGDRLPGRNLFQSSTYTVTPTWALIAVSNDPPNMNAYDDALRDRLRALPFVHSLGEGGKLGFTRGEKLETYRRQTDTDLIAGFVAWAVEGLERVFRAQDVHQAQASVRHTRQFWSDADPLTPFWEQIEDVDRRLREGVKAGELRSMYLAWCEQEGIRKPLAAGTPWGDACRAQGLFKERVTSGPDKGKEVWKLSEGGLFEGDDPKSSERVNGSGLFSESSLMKELNRERVGKQGLPVHPFTRDGIPAPPKPSPPGGDSPAQELEEILL